MYMFYVKDELKRGLWNEVYFCPWYAFVCLPNSLEPDRLITYVYPLLLGMTFAFGPY